VKLIGAAGAFLVAVSRAEFSSRNETIRVGSYAILLEHFQLRRTRSQVLSGRGALDRKC
jgi:hypothetical protein